MAEQGDNDIWPPFGMGHDGTGLGRDGKNRNLLEFNFKKILKRSGILAFSSIWRS